ncbi:NACHT domain-containing protein [Fusarium sp. LHS14.1]|nr:NACHT domain-containing protein [Fusarium sp. LHS14.1]
MSGMEPLAVLGLVCNIMQLLSFGGEAVSLCRKIYKTGEIDPSLKDYSSQTAKICESLNDNPISAAADKLNHELQLLTPTSGASRWTRGFTAPIKAILHQHRLTKLEKELNNLTSSMDTQLLSLGLLATTLQKVSSGQQDLSQQMVKALEDAQNRLNAEYLRNQRTIEQQITATTRDLQDERVRAQQEKRENEQRQDWDHLLKSLHFDARTERVNMITQEYSDTCRWIFRPSTEYGHAKPQPAYSESHQGNWPSFTKWLQSEEPPIYWICGKPGSGKSTLIKFIASDESPTRNFLKQWQPDVRILSHYFWLAGSPMQNNIKGFLCSLVYQALSLDMPSALDLLQSNPGIKRKSFTTDWDQKQLRRILISLAHQPGKAFCLFIDGLDELPPEESLGDLIDIITELQSPQVKLCLSSRPEPAMKMYLGDYPTLHMHAFIRNDISKYAKGILSRAMSRRNDRFNVDYLVHQISPEADGVFLWAVLVARSLERGIEKGDSLQLLVGRLRQMPKSLSDLYSSMWQRLGDDRETYQKGFSQYMDLNVLLAERDMICLTLSRKVTVFELMAATNTSFQDKYLNQDDKVSKEELESLCRDTRNSIEAWSAGLLTVTAGFNSRDSGPGPYCDLEFYNNMTVECIHRTARDFLLKEAEGQKLWKRVDVS